MPHLPLFAALLLASPSYAQELAEICVGEGTPRAVCDCAEESVTSETSAIQRELYLEVALLSGLNREGGASATVAWNDAVVEVAGNFGYGVGDVYEIVNEVEALYRTALGRCR